MVTHIRVEKCRADSVFSYSSFPGVGLCPPCLTSVRFQYYQRYPGNYIGQNRPEAWPFLHLYRTHLYVNRN
jgi:hypothetical protein